MDIKLNTMSVTELRRLEGKIAAELTRRENSARKDALKAMKKIAADHGLSLTDVLKDATPASTKAETAKTKRKASSKKGKPVPVKYRNPADTTQGWTGRGRKPLWVASWLAEGKSLNELLVS